MTYMSKVTWKLMGHCLPTEILIPHSLQDLWYLPEQTVYFPKIMLTSSLVIAPTYLVLELLPHFQRSMLEQQVTPPLPLLSLPIQPSQHLLRTIKVLEIFCL